MILLEKLFKWMFISGTLVLMAAWWQRDKLPDPDFYSKRIDAEPRQLKTERAGFRVSAGDQRYDIKPLYEYELNGVVVSMHHADSWADIYHHGDWQDFLNLKDLCVIWGDNVRSGVYQEMDFKNTTWTCWAYWPNRSVGKRFKMPQLSNNHLLADSEAVQQAILDARPGDQIRLRGYLAEYRNPANRFNRGTSVSRTDTGNGACETIYVERFDVLRQANAGWRKAFGLSVWLVPLSLAAWIVLLAINPVRRNVHR